MAITQVTAPASVPAAIADYQAQNAHISAFNMIVNNQPFILTNSENTSIPAIAIGSYIQFGGNLYIVDTEDYTITGTPVDGNNYIRLSGTTTLTAEWLQDISSYVWNPVYGYKYTGSYAILPYLVVKASTEYEKYSMGAVTVQYKMNQNVRTTDSPTFASVNTGQGATEVHLMNQNVRTTDSPTFNALTVASLDTGQGANELYAMNQNVRTTDSVEFAHISPNSATIESFVISENSTLVIPKGIYMLSRSTVSGSEQIYLEAKAIGGTWSTFQLLSVELIAVISDGVSIRFKNDDSTYSGIISSWKF